MTNHIQVIDLFAGPGGLGEGFSAFKAGKKYPFKIAASVEKEPSAHATLTLRAFFRQFKNGKAPKDYYEYLRGNITKQQLFDSWPDQYKAAVEETLLGPKSLGEDNKIIDQAILKAIGENNDRWVLIGGPPCQAYSLAGRSRNKGIENYRAEDDPRSSLYKEYLRIIEKFRPAVFVMENVKGMLTAKLNGDLVFHSILNDLSDPGKALNKRGCPGYRIHSLVKDRAHGDATDPHEYVIHCEKFGIPQTRHRVILLGIREDIEGTPETLKPETSITTGQAIGSLPALRSSLSRYRKSDTQEIWASAIKQEAHAVLNDVSDIKVQRLMKRSIRSMEKSELNCGSTKLLPCKGLYRKMPRALAAWYRDMNLGGVTNHESRGHMESDLVRYLFCACHAMVHEVSTRRASPTLKTFPDALLPAHENADSGDFIDRFKVQERSHPASTITSHFSKDGNYFIHYDPDQCRSLTVREAARIQTFPDNYFFEGPRTGQYVQVGNAVPPLLARQIAEIVHKLLK